MDITIYIEDYKKELNGSYLIWADFVSFATYRDFALNYNLPLPDREFEYKTMFEISGMHLSKRIFRESYYVLTIKDDVRPIINDESLLFGFSLDLSESNDYTLEKSDYEPDWSYQNTVDAEETLENILSNIPDDKPFVRVNNVGQGNWNELHLGDTVFLVYDIGTFMLESRKNVRMIIDRFLPPYLKQERKPILTISHWDKDHYHCLLEMTPKELSTFSVLVCSSVLPSATAIRARDRIVILGSVPVVYSPLKCVKGLYSKVYLWERGNKGISLYYGEYNHNVNSSGIQMLLESQTGYVLLTGDAGWYQASHILNMMPACGFNHEFNIVVPHHGSGKDLTYLGFVLPCGIHSGIAAISVNKKQNSYGHPAKGVISYLSTLKFKIIRTDKAAIPYIDIYY